VSVEPDRFRDALAHWASGVSVVAVRDEGRVLSTTVSALISVAVEPPLILISLGVTAQVLPYLVPGRSFAVNVLSEEQGRIASVFADSYPAGAPAFPPEGEPWIDGALVRLGCTVDRIHAAADHRLVLARVEHADVEEGNPLIRYARTYRRLADG
jgi:flavin reductase (DIM6/NTAB) family NADH-FMN oxidoreductase RutF